MKFKRCAHCESSDLTTYPVAGLPLERFAVKCNTCQAYGPQKRSKAEAEAAWNTRPTEDAAVEALRAVKAIFDKGTENTSDQEWDEAYGLVLAALLAAEGE